MELLKCEIYAIFTISVTALWVCYGRKWSLNTLALVIFFPGLIAAKFVNDGTFIHQILAYNQVILLSFYYLLLTQYVILYQFCGPAMDINPLSYLVCGPSDWTLTLCHTWSVGPVTGH